MPYLGTIKLISFNISIVLVFANLQNSLEKTFYFPHFFFFIYVFLNYYPRSISPNFAPK